MNEKAKMTRLTEKSLEDLLKKILADIKDAKESGNANLEEYIKNTDIQQLTSADITTVYEKIKTDVN